MVAGLGPMELIITILLLTIVGGLGIFLWSFLVLWKQPPVIRIEGSFNVPPEFKLVLQKLPANIETDKPIDPPIPVEILEYVELESEAHAVVARKQRARALYAEAHNWDVVLRMLQMEDSALPRD
jgi:hypothetical protein